MELITTKPYMESGGSPILNDLAFSIGDIETVIEILRNKLYQFPIRTLTQEILSNAKDACWEVGNSEGQIEITVPTKMEPVLKIRDYGPGLSPERVAEVFVKYGASTKRNSATQIG